MTSLDEIFERSFEKALAAGVPESKIQKIADRTVKKLLPIISEDFLKILKRNAPPMLRNRRADDEGFRRRNLKRWKKALDLLELVWEVSHEEGAKFNNQHRPDAVKTRDYTFEALTRLHARSLLVSREVICLVEGGFPDGALSRWRTLHELSVIASFLQGHDQELAHRYLASFEFAAKRAAEQNNFYAVRAKLSIFSDQEISKMRSRCDLLIQRFGEAMKNEYGWAALVLNKDKPTFFDLERATKLDHWRPRYRWASQHTHAGSRPGMALLGVSEATQNMLLVGQSNSGFTDPIQMTALSLTTATCALLSSRPTLENSVIMHVLIRLSGEVGPLALKLQRRTFKAAQKKSRRSKARTKQKSAKDN